MPSDHDAGAAAGTPPPTSQPSAPLRIEGLPEALDSLRVSLDGHHKAVKFSWISGRLMVLRNIVIASAVLSVTLIAAVLLVREAWRPTLTITSFDVPASVAERGITGEVVARNLYNELLKRRQTITTFDTGRLTSLSGERQSDVASPDGKFSLQSLFRYLRSLTDSETTIGGEMLLDGDQVRMTARVSGHPQKSVTGPLKDWDGLLGELANYVFERTQPVVLAGYLGETARTPEDLERLSRLVYRMVNGAQRPPDAALALAYHAYGQALYRSRNREAALSAWARARELDPKLAAPYWRTANALWISDPVTSKRLFRESEGLEGSVSGKRFALNERFSQEASDWNCPVMRELGSQLIGQPDAKDRLAVAAKARVLFACDYQHTQARRMLEELTSLHPERSENWNLLGVVLSGDGKHREQGHAAYLKSVALDKEVVSTFPRFNLAMSAARLGRHDEAAAAFGAALAVRNVDPVYSNAVLAFLHQAKGESAEAERLARGVLASPAAPRFIGPVLADALAAQGRTDEALQVLRAYQGRFPHHCPGFDEAAALLLKAGRQAEAFAQWQAGVRAIPKCDLNYLHPAQALIERGRTSEARVLLQALLKASPGSDGAEIAGPLLAAMATPSEKAKRAP